jgi:vesicle coat complex subunit
MFTFITNMIDNNNKKKEDARRVREARARIISALANDDDFITKAYSAITPDVVKNTFTK